MLADVAEEADRKKKVKIVDQLVQSCGHSQADPDDPRPTKAHSGFCVFCGRVHKLLRSAEAVNAVKSLHETVVAAKGGVENCNDKMLGVLVCKNEKNETVMLYAYSGPSDGYSDVLDNNANYEWAIKVRPTKIVSFGSREREFVEDDAIDNPPGNCAAQKLLHYAANYNQEKLATRKRSLEKARAKRDRKFTELFKEETGDLIFDMERLTSEEMEMKGLSHPKHENIVQDLKGRNVATGRRTARRYVKFVSKDKTRWDDEVQECVDDVNNTPYYIPFGLAEIWIGSDTGGFPNKKNGEIIDSCYTCHNILGDVLCGLEECQSEHEKKFKND